MAGSNLQISELSGDVKEAKKKKQAEMNKGENKIQLDLVWGRQLEQKR